MATQIVNNTPELLTDPQEVEFLRAYREADDDGKRRIVKTLQAAVAVLLPPVETIKAMTATERRALIDSLPLGRA